MANSLDVVETLASNNDWTFERTGEGEITLIVEGRCADYEVAFTWRDDIETLHISSAYELKIPAEKRPAVTELISLINQQQWVGHFDPWFSDGIILYRHALVLPDGVRASDRQCELMLATAVEVCERYYKAFQYVVSANQPPQKAIDACMIKKTTDVVH